MSSTRAPEPIHPRQALLSKPAKSFAVLVALIGVAYLVPGAERFRLLSPKQVEEQTSPAASDSASAPVGEAQLVDETTDRPELAAPQHAQIPEAKPGLPPLSPAAQSKASPLPVEDPSGTALDAFHAALLAVEHKRPGAIARIVHYGDSLLAVDFVTGTLRRKLQERFGDAGHGYMPIANPWPGYFHNDVYRRATTDWTVSRVVGPFAADDLYGLGGVTFIGRSRASRAEYGTSTKSDFGRAVSRFGVQYLEQPDGGVFEISVDKDAQVIRVETAAQTPGLKERMIQVPDGEHRFEFRVVKAPVRAFGTWMERGVPGVVLDSIGIQGGRMRFLDKSDDAHWAAALQMRNPSLVVFQFGLNESADGFAYPMQRYRETSLAVLQQARRALPKASCLVIAPNDTAVKKGTSIVSRGVMPHLVKVQREVSAAAGCAFFNTWEAMGGLGSMPTWYGRGLGQPDLTHPTTIGADIIGSWIFSALMDSYASYRARAPEPTGGAAPAAPATASSGAAARSAAPRL